MLLGSFFIIAMTLVSARGIVLSERIQNVLIAIQFGVLIIVSIIALVRVFAGTAGEQAITPSLAWLWPGGLDAHSIAAAIILCIFIYWGWDTCLAVGEETKNSDRTPAWRRSSPRSFWYARTFWWPTRSSRSPTSGTKASD